MTWVSSCLELGEHLLECITLLTSHELNEAEQDRGGKGENETSDGKVRKTMVMAEHESTNRFGRRKARFVMHLASLRLP